MIAAVLALAFSSAAALTPAATARGEAGGEPPGAPPSAPPAYPPTPDRTPTARAVTDGIAPELSGVPVRGGGVSQAEDTLSSLQGRLQDALDEEAEATRAAVDLGARALELDGRRLEAERTLAGLRSEQQAAESRAADARRQADTVRDYVRALAAAAYMGYGGERDEAALLTSAAVAPSERRSTYARNVLEQKRDERRAYLNAEAEASRQAAAKTAQARDVEVTLGTLAGEVVMIDAAADQVEERRQDALVRQADLRRRLPDAELALARSRRTALVVGLDLPLVVLDGLWKASAAIDAERPGCRLSWSLLAGISKVESGHGTFAGATVDGAGRVAPPIIGVALDGAGVALIGDSDGGRHDRDATFDRAVGPMQFIPSSWAIFGRDGDGDGVEDPHNYYDAARAAADHLCRGGADTSTEAGRRAAVLSYNQSEDYLRTVAAYADAYARFTIPA